MIAASALGAGLLISAFLFGFRHGIDWDHIAAITDIAGSQEDRRRSVFFGTLYALGHALVVFLIGTAAILLGERLPSSIDTVMERVVGITLITLGVFVLWSLIRHGREFRMRSRWMLIFSGVRSLTRRVRGTGRTDDEPEVVHVHVDSGGGSVAMEVATDLPVSEWHHGHHGRPGHHHHLHPEPDVAMMDYGTATAFVVGMIHGVGAETPTQLVIFLAAAGAGGRLAGEVVLVAFLVGLLASNSLITLGAAFGFIKASERWAIYATIAVLTGVFSLIVGCLFLFGKAGLLPAFFGG